MTIEVHIDWLGETFFVGRLRPSERGGYHVLRIRLRMVG